MNRAHRTAAKRKFKFAARASSVTAGLFLVAVIFYLGLLIHPQPLFAYSERYGAFIVYSREPSGDELKTVLDAAERRLEVSPLYERSGERRIFLTGSHSMYALLSHKAYRSFANSVPFFDNVIVNKADAAGDKVFLNREKNNFRSLSGVIAHETIHLFIRRRYGTAQAVAMPVWKNEGYCEYIAGDSSISFAEGMRLWREQPSDDSGYRYLKYHAMVKYLLENERVSVDELFTGDFSESDVAARAFAAFK